MVTSPVAIFPPLLHHAITSFLIAVKENYYNSCRRSLLYICMPSVGTFAIEQNFNHLPRQGAAFMLFVTKTVVYLGTIHYLWYGRGGGIKSGGHTMFTLF